MSPRTPARHSTIELSVPTAHCAGCRQGVLDELQRLDGVVSVEVPSGTDSACITFDPSSLDPHEIVSRLTEAGYPPLSEPHLVEARQ
jgi:copper chaperone CopZ